MYWKNYQTKFCKLQKFNNRQLSGQKIQNVLTPTVASTKEGGMKSVKGLRIIAISADAK